MPLENLPNGFTVPTRAEVRDRYQRDAVLRQPGAPTGDGSQAFIDGSVLADALMPLYADAQSIGRGADLADMTRAQLQAECRALGLPEEMPASGASGLVQISASAGGVFIPDSLQLKYEGGGITLRCATTDTYFDGRSVPIIAVDTGPTTNLPAGTILKWQGPPPGLGGRAIVLADANGDGLVGGRSVESDDDIRNRIATARAEQAASGNVAAVRDLVKRAGRALGIAVQEVFVYPAITGSGHYAYVFTLRPGPAGSTRCPDNVEIAAVRAHVLGALPYDDGIFSAEIIEDPVVAKIGIEWASKAVGWTDASPWPTFADGYTVTTVTSALAFRVTATGGSPTAPQAGQTIAFYDKSRGTFARKRISSVATISSGVYDVVIDDTNNASNVNYKPVVGEPFCPHAASLDIIVQPLTDRVNTLGPGEQVAAPFDEGYRQKRYPPDPVEWPSDLRHKDLEDVENLPQVHDASWLAPSIPHTPPTGVAGASSNMVAIDRVLAFPI